MPDEYLDGLSETERASRWATGLARPRDSDPVLVAEDATGVVGFAAIGAATDPAGAGELRAINIDPDHWGRGVGRALIKEVCRELSDLGFDRAILWVLPTNRRARRFYESTGWEADGAERIAELLGVTVPEVRYGRALPPQG